MLRSRLNGQGKSPRFTDGGGGPLPPVGSLSVGVATRTAILNIDTYGLSDWTIYENGTGTPTQRKLGGTGLITDMFTVGPTATSLISGTGNTPGIDWANGTPTANGNSSWWVTSNINNGGTATSGYGEGLTFPADATNRTAYIFAGGWTSNMRVIAELSNGAAPQVIDDSWTTGVGAAAQNLITINYNAAAPGQVLTVHVICQLATGAYANITISGAAYA